MKIWTECEVSKLLDMIKNNLNYEEIAKELNTTKQSIYTKCSRLKVYPKKRITKYELDLSVDKFTLEDYLQIWEKCQNKIKKVNDCLEWQKTSSRNGYGHVRTGKGLIHIHRISLSIKLGYVLPSEIWTLHHCDNPKCVNPLHLYAGNQMDNMRDMIKRNRGCGQFKKGQEPIYVVRGEDSKNSKMTNKTVLEAREIYSKGEIGHKRIAKIFKVSSGTMRKILNRKTWQHI